MRTAMPSLPPQFSSVKWACGHHTPFSTVLVSAASATHAQLPSETIKWETAEINTRNFRLQTIQGCMMNLLVFPSCQRIHAVWLPDRQCTVCLAKGSSGRMLWYLCSRDFTRQWSLCAQAVTLAITSQYIFTTVLVYDYSYQYLTGVSL